MAEVILMPRLSDTMTEGVIAAWHKKIGDPVKKGELLADIETDKATMELESYKDGTLLHIGGDKGSKIQVDELLAIVGNPGEDISQLVKGGEQKNKEQGMKKEESTASAQPQTTNSKPQTSSMDLSKMEEVVLMPRLSDTMTEGVIASWHKKVGDAVKKGEVLADIETDKATMELESYKNGTLLYIGAQKGEKIAVNDLLCIIGEKGKVDVDAIVAGVKNGGAAGAPASVTTAETQTATASNNAEPAETAAESGAGENGRVKASPLAK